jgi:hypothetical protein
MSFLVGALKFAESLAETAANYQMQQQSQQVQTKGRTARRSQGCTPCAAMASVDQTRKQLGFKVK